MAGSGLWTEHRADAVSLENFGAGFGVPPLNRTLLSRLTSSGLSSAQMVRAAISDLLLSQCDRNPQNALLSPAARGRRGPAADLHLIDNDQAYGAGGSGGGGM